MRRNWIARWDCIYEASIQGSVSWGTERSERQQGNANFVAPRDSPFLLGLQDYLVAFPRLDT